ncbi:MAG: response regulator transcription factor [Flavobacterium sp.]|nr:response regulator transcription factor [Flavobacterium sp.]
MLKIAIVDDHQLIRKSLKLMISSFDGIEVLFEAENGKDLLQNLENNNLDVVLLDIHMPKMDGFETCTILHRLYPSLKILVLSVLDDKESIQKILDCGAHGYLTKNVDPEQFQKAIFDIYKNGFYFDTQIGSVLHEIIIGDYKKPKHRDPLEDITQRELQLIKLVASGLSNSMIAERLFINVRTVEAHRKRIMEKIGAKNFTNVILQALKFHYLSIEDL